MGDQLDLIVVGVLRRVLAIAVGAAALRIVLGQFVIDPLTARYWPAASATAGADQITGKLGYVLLALGIVWGFAAFGEEFSYIRPLASAAAPDR